MGGKIGYKYFFKDWVGIRGYGSVNYTETSFHAKDNQSNLPYEISNISYSLNADALFNFYNTEIYNLGAFVGIGLGGQNWKGDVRMYGVNTNESYMGFYADAKIGLRVNAANHGAEFIAKIPFVGASKNINGVKATTSNTYQVLLGYNYTF